jgi:Flp pilus assembly protein TadD
MSESPEASRSTKRPDEADVLADYAVEQAPPPWWRTIWLKRWMWILLVALLLLGAAALWGPRVYREAKARRALAMLADGETLLKRGDMTGAGTKFRAAMALSPGDARLLRGLYLVNARMGDPESVRKLSVHLEDASATTEELLVLASTALGLNDVDLARRAIEALPPSLSGADDTERLLVRASLLARDGKLSDAIALLRNAKVEESRRSQVRFALSRLLLLTPETIPDGLLELKSLSEGSSETALLSLRTLAALQMQKRVEGDPLWCEALRNHPQATYGDRLLAAQLEISNSPDSHDQVVARMIEEARALGLPDRLALSGWLIRSGSPDRVEEIFSEQESASNVDVVVARADALSAAHRLVEARKLLKESQCPGLEEAVRHLFLARLATDLHDEVTAAQEWELVRSSMVSSPSKVVRYVATYAGKMGKPDEARRALQLLVERNEADPAVYVALLGTLPGNVSASDVLVILEKLLTVAPDMPEARSDRAYLSLLLDKDLQQSQATAEELFKKEPEHLSYLSVLALAKLKSGDPQGAEDLYKGREIAWDNAFASARVVRVAVLFANGKKAEAEKILGSLSQLSLRPEERELIQAR